MTTPRTGDTITTPEELDALPNRTAIHDANRELWERNGTILDGLLEAEHAAWVGTTGGLCHSREINLPATVLYVPGEQPRPSVTDDARAACGCDLSVGPNALHIVDGHDDAAGRAETTAAPWPCSQYGRLGTAHSLDTHRCWDCVHGTAETPTATTEDMTTRLAAAEAELDRLCNGGRFTMSIPAREGYDSDLLIQAALSDLRSLLATPRTRPTLAEISLRLALEMDCERVYDDNANAYYCNEHDVGWLSDTNQCARAERLADAVLALLGGDDRG